MEQVEDFLKQASECLAMAAKASNSQVKSDLEALAKKWQQLAAEREKFLESAGRSQNH
jgi:hypothetical protein